MEDVRVWLRTQAPDGHMVVVWVCGGSARIFTTTVKILSYCYPQRWGLTVLVFLYGYTCSTVSQRTHKIMKLMFLLQVRWDGAGQSGRPAGQMAHRQSIHLDQWDYVRVQDVLRLPICPLR